MEGLTRTSRHPKKIVCRRINNSATGCGGRRKYLRVGKLLLKFRLDRKFFDCENHLATTGLSYPRALTPIADPIHTRIELTLFDRDLVDTSLFQRLHFVLQNSVNYVSFPPNKNSRFPHSLGTAHTCSLLFSKGLSNAKTDVLKRFLNNAADFFAHIYAEIARRRSAGVQVETDPGTLHKMFEKAHTATISGRSSFLHAPLNRTYADDRLAGQTKIKCGEFVFSADYLIDTLQQALRLYALSHDLGHMPMSHAFEEALSKTHVVQSFHSLKGGSTSEFSSHLKQLGRDFASQRKWVDSYKESFADDLSVDVNAIEVAIGKKEIHETRSLILFDIFSSKLSDTHSCFAKQNGGSVGPEISAYTSLIHRISMCLMMGTSIDAYATDKKTPHRFTFLNSIRKIVDGTVDGDRLDYTIRDIRETGSTSSTYDLNRITNNSILISDPEDERRFSFGFFHRALPGIEQFFESSYQCYKYLIFHRTAVRSNACMERLLSLIFALSYQEPQAEIAMILDRYGYIERDAENKVLRLLPIVEEHIERVEDYTLRSMLHEVKSELSKDRADSPPSDEDPVSVENLSVEYVKMEARCLLDVILFRDFSNIATLFKDWSVTDVLDMAGITQHPGVKPYQIARFVRHLTDSFSDHSKRLRRKIFDESKGEFDVPIFLNFITIKPKCIDLDRKENLFQNQVWIEDRFGRIDGLLSCSPILDAMKRRLMRDRVIRVFAVSDNMKEWDEKKLKFAERAVIEFISEIWTEFQNVIGGAILGHGSGGVVLSRAA